MTMCNNCGGTGKIVLMRSWFHADGYTKAKCGICNGSGQSSYRVPADVVSFQSELRERAKQREPYPDLRDAARDTLEALGAILTADFDCDDSGAMQRVLETEDA